MTDGVTQRKASYDLLLADVQSALEDETDPIVWMTSLSCLIKQRLGFFWVGFYRWVDGELRVGPYQGTFGCLRIPLGRGVCGAAARRRETVLVRDVHQFPDHISCDSQSRSEIVVPVLDAAGRLQAVLDIDSDQLDDFSPVDQQALEALVARMKDLEWTRGS
jgi:L-methionine (R)-S-oxide reductase